MSSETAPGLPGLPGPPAAPAVASGSRSDSAPAATPPPAMEAECAWARTARRGTLQSPFKGPLLNKLEKTAPFQGFSPAVTESPKPDGGDVSMSHLSELYTNTAFMMCVGIVISELRYKFCG